MAEGTYALLPLKQNNKFLYITIQSKISSRLIIPLIPNSKRLWRTISEHREGESIKVGFGGGIKLEFYGASWVSKGVDDG